MRSPIRNFLPDWLRRLRRPGLPEAVCAAIALFTLILPERWALERNRAEREAELRDSLRLAISATEDSLANWTSQVTREALWWAELAEVRESVEALSRENGRQPGANELRKLRSLFAGNSTRRRSSSGRLGEFLIVAADGTPVAGARDWPLGGKNSPKDFPAIRAALAGEARVASAPARENEPPRSGRLQVAVPVRGEDGRIVAALAFEVDAADSLATVLARGNVGQTGSSHLYSMDGQWLAHSKRGAGSESAQQAQAATACGRIY
jgi:hypothetical protein